MFSKYLRIPEAMDGHTVKVARDFEGDIVIAFDDGAWTILTLTEDPYDCDVKIVYPHSPSLYDMVENLGYPPISASPLLEWLVAAGIYTKEQAEAIVSGQDKEWRRFEEEIREHRYQQYLALKAEFEGGV